MSSVGVFISHSHQDDAFTRRLSNDLRAVGVDVWIDEKEIAYDDFVMKISDGLQGRQWLVLVMTPASLKSQWVRREVNAALNLVEKGRMRGVIPIVAAPCNDNDIPALWDSLHRYDATRNYDTALSGLLRAIGVTPSTSESVAASMTPPAPPAAQAASLSAMGPSQQYPARAMPAQQYAPQAMPPNAPQGVAQPQTAPLRPQPRRSGVNWLPIILGGVALVVISCIAISVVIEQSLGNTIKNASATKTAIAIDQTQPYHTNTPGKCDTGGADWSTSSNVTATCAANATHLVQGSQSVLGTIFFNWKSGNTFPANYSAEVTVSGMASNVCASELTRASGYTGYGFRVCGDGEQSIIRFAATDGKPTTLTPASLPGVPVSPSYTIVASSIGDQQCMQIGSQPKVCVTDATYTRTDNVDLAVDKAPGGGGAADFSNFTFTPLP
jgi:hypothetical protein